MRLIVYFYTREANGVTIAHAGREGRKRDALLFRFYDCLGRLMF